MVTILLRPATRFAGRYVNNWSQSSLYSIASATNTSSIKWKSIHRAYSIDSHLVQNPRIKYFNNLDQIRFNTIAAAQETTPEQQVVDRPNFRTLERIFATFEDRCQRNENVLEKDFVRTFDYLTRFFEGYDISLLKDDLNNISLYSTILLRCCGKLMLDVPPKGRELLAGNLWNFIKEKKIPLNISHYNSLLRVLNENDTTFDPKKILEEVEAANLSPDRVTYQRCIHQYCVQGDIAGATSLLEKMKNMDMELNERIFASLMIGYGKQESPPSITEMFELMKSNNVEPGSKSYTAAFVTLAARWEKDPKVADEFKKIVDLMKQDDVQLSINEIIDLMSHIGPLRKSSDVVAKLIEDSLGNMRGPVSTKYRLLASMLKTNQLEEASKLFWSQKYSERVLERGPQGLYWIKAIAKHFNVPLGFIEKECDEMKAKGINIKPYHQLYYSAGESGRLDVVRLALKKISEEEPLEMHYYWPLIAQAKDESEVVHALKNDLNPQMPTDDLLDTFAHWVWPKFSENPSKLFEHNKELNYDKSLLMNSFLSYSVQQNKVMQAIELISNAPQEFVDDSVEAKQQESEAAGDDENGDLESSLKSPTTSRRDDKNQLVQRLLHQIAEETKDPELVKKAFNMCNLPGQEVSRRKLAALVRVHLLKKDYEGALEEFLRIAREYQVAPCRSELMQHCLDAKNPEHLQKIMNVSTELYGESNALFDLAVCCLRCNKLKQAQKIFASPGFRVNSVRVYKTCRLLAKSLQVDVLENFVSLVRDMYDVNQETLYQILLDTYERTSNAKRALHLWNIMQEEEFQPSKRSLLMIAEILEKNNIEVPFQKPRIFQNNDRTQKSPSDRDPRQAKDVSV